jgi:uncharacterized membrane protein
MKFLVSLLALITLWLLFWMSNDLYEDTHKPIYLIWNIIIWLMALQVTTWGFNWGTLK